MDSPITDGAATTPKRTITITFSHHDAQPPVFVAGTMTSPPWQLCEMSHTRTEASPIWFFKDFADVEEGRHQYKFRLGSGEWWAVDEGVETVTDADGNVNNLLVVAPAETQEPSVPSATVGDFSIDGQGRADGEDNKSISEVRSQPQSDVGVPTSDTVLDGRDLKEWDSDEATEVEATPSPKSLQELGSKTFSIMDDDKAGFHAESREVEVTPQAARSEEMVTDMTKNGKPSPTEAEPSAEVAGSAMGDSAPAASAAADSSNREGGLSPEEITPAQDKEDGELGDQACGPTYGRAHKVTREVGWAEDLMVALISWFGGFGVWLMSCFVTTKHRSKDKPSS